MLMSPVHLLPAEPEVSPCPNTVSLPALADNCASPDLSSLPVATSFSSETGWVATPHYLAGLFPIHPLLAERLPDAQGTLPLFCLFAGMNNQQFSV